MNFSIQVTREGMRRKEILAQNLDGEGFDVTYESYVQYWPVGYRHVDCSIVRP